jgi:RNA polymerase sigma-70 factor (ECF subfamily)
LRRWVRVIAVREAFKRRKRSKREVGIGDDELFDALTSHVDPELEVVKKRAAEHFRAAFLASVSELSRQERTVLRLHVLESLSIDDIAPVFGVHRATVARWIAGARDRILQLTRKRLMQALELNPQEVDSLIRLVQSRMDVSLEDVLKSRD